MIGMPHVSGTNLYGRVDNIPGVGYLATKFAHVWFIPLAPEQSWLVLHRPGTDGFFKARTEWSGLCIPTTMWKSVLAAWLRTLPVLYAVWRLLVLLVELSSPEPVNWLRAAVAGALVAAAMATRYVSRASFRRAVTILKLADAPEEVARAVEKAYGRPIREQWPGRVPAAASGSGAVETGRAESAESTEDDANESLDGAAGAHVVDPQLAARSAHSAVPEDEEVEQPGLISQAMRPFTPPKVRSRRELQRLGLVAIALGSPILVGGYSLGRGAAAVFGVRSSLFFLPAIYGGMVLVMGVYRGLFGLWPGLAKDTIGARAARIGLGVVALSAIGAALILGMLAL
jgi:hypothetical protein